VAHEIPLGRSKPKGDDETLRAYVGARLKLREYLLPLEPKRDGIEWSGSKPLVLPWVNATTTDPPNIEHHKWTVGRHDGISHQKSSAFEAGSISTKDLESSESRPPLSSLSGSASSLWRHRSHDQYFKGDSSLFGKSSSANDRTRPRRQHEARLDNSRFETRASSPVVTGTQEKARTSSPYRRMLSFVNGETPTRTKSWCSSNE
jgi:hypothetical protein